LAGTQIRVVVVNHDTSIAMLERPIPGDRSLCDSRLAAAINGGARP
jgi:hypothetical protein